MSNATKSSPPVFDEGTQTWKEYKKELDVICTILGTRKQREHEYVNVYVHEDINIHQPLTLKLVENNPKQMK